MINITPYADKEVMTEEKPPAWWLRVCATIVGFLGSTLAAVILVLIGALLGAGGGASGLVLLIGTAGFIGGCMGFAMPRQTLEALLIFLPDLGE